MNRALIGLLLAFMLAPSGSLAQQPRAAAIDSIFARFDKPGMPGCVLGVMRDDALIYQKGYGYANLDYDIPNAPHMIYYVGSVSKQFTAATILLMAQRGLISLDDPVRKYFPELPEYNRPLSIRHLVHHTGGVRDVYTLMALAGIQMDDVLSERRALGLITSQRELNFDPGNDYLYSNSGYYLLALLVKRVTGKSLREYADEVLFRPLGMSNTHFHDEPDHIFKNRAFAYAPDGRGGYRIDYLLNFDKVGAGGLYTTIGDLAKWDRNFDEPTVGGPAFVRAMHERGVLTRGDTLSYAFGLQIAEQRGLRTVRHGGSLMGFRADYVRFPEQKLSIATLCNAADAAPGTLANRVAELYLGPQMTAAAPSRAAAGISAQPPPRIQVENLSDYAGTYWSDELNVEYRVSAENDGLRIEFADQVREAVPIARDEFRSGSTRYRFVRSNGRVSGFTVNAGRVTNIRFVKR